MILFFFANLIFVKGMELKKKFFLRLSKFAFFHTLSWGLICRVWPFSHIWARKLLRTQRA